MGKHSKVSYSTEWKLGENVVLPPMECLTPTVQFDIFITISHLFVYRPTLQLTTFEHQVYSTTQMHWGQKAAKRKERGHFKLRSPCKKAV